MALGLTIDFSFIGDNDARVLEKVTKDDIISLFLSRVHPSSSTRSKLSVHLRSQKPPPPRMSAAAVEAFEALLKRPELAGRWKEELAGDETPIVDDFRKYWESQDIEPEILAAIPDLVVKYPMERQAARMEGVTYIEDVEAFKKSLEISEESRPLVEWGDLPMSKY
jgi:insulysin